MKCHVTRVYPSMKLWMTHMHRVTSRLMPNWIVWGFFFQCELSSLTKLVPISWQAGSDMDWWKISHPDTQVKESQLHPLPTQATQISKRLFESTTERQPCTESDSDTNLAVLHKLTNRCRSIQVLIVSWDCVIPPLLMTISLHLWVFQQNHHEVHRMELHVVFAA